MTVLLTIIIAFLAATTIVKGSDDRNFQRVLQVTPNINPLTANRT